MKTLIIGAKGMLGQELAKAFTEFNPTVWDVSDIDITDQSQVNEKMSMLAPELIINAAAYTNVDACEENEELATKVNGTAVGYLARVASNLGATLVHYSTDYVFDGTQQEGYTELDTPHPINAYGRSKLAGEQDILSLRGSEQYPANDRSNLNDENRPFGDDKVASLASTPPRNDRWYIIRTAWLYGHAGKNFVETMLSMAQAGEPLKVVDDQIGSPTYAPDLAQATFDLVKSGKPAGIYHRTNSETISWYGFAKEIFEVYGKDVDLVPCATMEYPRPAKRPTFSTLVSTKLPSLRSWQEALREYASFHH
ncbi:hypothetical protein BK004_04110 [bacterium CG10_46_32]|nr:MAG: hypothetical protein BK004_04110 [bacterium CG10_46_32]PIR55803.1 MAG: dTDP-4-dehydrorhamnose reductase [Parcubacteria group bacterium CG10_big_fil_rev_8_21_14_0_10_46_32]